MDKSTYILVVEINVMYTLRLHRRPTTLSNIYLYVYICYLQNQTCIIHDVFIQSITASVQQLYRSRQ